MGFIRCLGNSLSDAKSSARELGKTMVCSLGWKNQTDIPEAKKQNENDFSLQAMARAYVAARQSLSSLLMPLSIPVMATHKRAA